MPAHPHDTVGKGWCHGKPSALWRQRSCTVFAKQQRGGQRKGHCRKKGRDTVGELKSTEICVSHMPSWKAKKLGTLAQEKVLLEP
jgi:hypothetical protein